jgi:hypothetical protein
MMSSNLPYALSLSVGKDTNRQKYSPNSPSVNRSNFAQE